MPCGCPMMPTPQDHPGTDNRRFRGSFRIDRDTDLFEPDAAEGSEGPETAVSDRQRTISGCLLGIVTIVACNLVVGGLVALLYTMVK